MARELYRTADLQSLFRSQKVCTMEEMKAALGTDFDLTVFRKLKGLSYRTSYSHRGKYYTLEDFVRYDARGLWFCDPARFSQYGTLVETVEQFVVKSVAGHTARELQGVLGVEVKEPLLKLWREQRITREEVAGRYVYYGEGNDSQKERRQSETLFPSLGIGLIPVRAEVKAAVVLFWSLLNEKQRRLYAGLESLMMGHGGDSKLSELLGLDVHTIARGRQELLWQDVELERIRKQGGGRELLEKKRRKSYGNWKN